MHREITVPIDQSSAVFLFAFLDCREDSVEIISIPCGMGCSIRAYFFDDGIIFQADKFLRGA